MKMASDINFCQEQATWRNHIHQLHSFSCLYVCIYVCMCMCGCMCECLWVGLGAREQPQKSF